MLKKFLFTTGMNMETKSCFNHVNKIRYRIAEMYKEHTKALYGRANVMSDLFEIEIGELVKYFTKKKKGA